MTLVRLHTSEQFVREVLDHKGPVLVLFPGQSEAMNVFVAQQFEIVESWRPYLRIFVFKSSSADVTEDDSCLIALYSFGNFVAASSKYCFAEHIDAWLSFSLREFNRILEDSDDGRDDLA